MRPFFKIAIILSLLLCFVFLINSCCTKKGCLGADDIYELKLYNFTKAELDTIVVFSYVKNSNFITFVDSTLTYGIEQSDYFVAQLKKRIDIDFDYLIKIQSTGQEFKLTNFQIKSEGCNGCFPYRPKSDYYNKLVGYSVNSLYFPFEEIKIYK